MAGRAIGASFSGVNIFCLMAGIAIFRRAYKYTVDMAVSADDIDVCSGQWEC